MRKAVLIIIRTAFHERARNSPLLLQLESGSTAVDDTVALTLVLIDDGLMMPHASPVRTTSHAVVGFFFVERAAVYYSQCCLCGTLTKKPMFPFAGTPTVPSSGREFPFPLMIQRFTSPALWICSGISLLFHGTVHLSLKNNLNQSQVLLHNMRRFFARDGPEQPPL